MNTLILIEDVPRDKHDAALLGRKLANWSFVMGIR
jgi:hypothetical protein